MTLPFWKRVLLPWVATFTVPPYAMQLCTTLYAGLLYFCVPLRPMLLAYQGYCIMERSTSQSSQMKPWIRKWQNTFGSLWWIRWTAEYFSTRLIKTVDLDPSKSYIFAYHPHGVISMGANLALSTNGCQFNKVFPGVSLISVGWMVVLVDLTRHSLLRFVSSRLDLFWDRFDGR